MRYRRFWTIALCIGLLAGFTTVAKAQSLNWRGEWNKSAMYSINDVVWYDGSSYVVVNPGGTSAGGSSDANPSANVYFCTHYSCTFVDPPLPGTYVKYWDKVATGFVWQGQWDVNAHYYPNDLVSYGGSLYVATAPQWAQGHTEWNPDSDVTYGTVHYWSRLAAGFNWKGAFDATMSYGTNDIVSLDGSSYMALHPVGAGSSPAFESGNWALIAQAGTPGAQGLQGPQGTPGRDGAPGAQGVQGPIGLQGVPGPQGPLGPTGLKGLNWRGEWDKWAVYGLNDVVWYDGSSYAVVNPGGTSAGGSSDANPSANVYFCTRYSCTLVDPPPAGSYVKYWDKVATGFVWQGQWDASAHYYPNDLVSYNGSLYLANKLLWANGHAEYNPDADVTYGPQNNNWSKLAAGFNWRGAFNSSVAYGTNDVVSLSGSSYVALHPVAGNGMSNPVYETQNWALIASVGGTGPQGPQGSQGAQGPRGSTGATGASGPQGPKGDTGATGSQGPAGPMGLTGPTGPQGGKGDTGATGVQGPKGDAGTTGVQGPKGDAGTNGVQGPKGDTGATGVQGPIGLTGTAGVQGIQGIQGLPGVPGAPGPQGQIGLGLLFEIQRISDDRVLTVPAGNKSLICLVTTAPDSVRLTLPPAATAVSRFVTITRVDSGKKVIVAPQSNEILDGARVPITMDGKFDSITLVTDGVEWVALFRQK